MHEQRGGFRRRLCRRSDRLERRRRGFRRQRPRYESVGGLIGDSHDAVVFDCFNTGAVDSAEYAGGIVGYTAESEFSRCYNIGAVNANSFAGAIVGKVAYNGSVFENCVYLEGCCASGGSGLPAGEDELTAGSAYPGFDFENVWSISSPGYPFARLVGVPAPQPLFGDADGDGEVSAADALITLRCALELMQLSPLGVFRADVNCDGIIDAADALLILRAALDCQPGDLLEYRRF